jgi:glycosyltransferase involved in cell wall biosynthesis
LALKVSLVTTVKDSADHVGEFLASVRAQTRMPDEIVVVDGGSTDATLDRLRGAEGITLIEEPGANISRGRNLAIQAATHDVLAVSDADCVLEPAWLERLLEPIESGGDVSMGTSVPVVDGFLQACIAAVNLPSPEELDEATFMPSARSVAFRRSAIEAAGGYPEWLDIGEDMYVNHRWRELGLDLRLARGAVVRWRLRRGLRATWRQYFRYARGDAIAGMHPERHALRFAVYGGLAASLLLRRRLPAVVALLAGAAYACRPTARAVSRAKGPVDRAAAAAAVPALMAFLDLAKMAGYVAGLPRRRRR